jgi:hypothetical protein
VAIAAPENPYCHTCGVWAVQHSTAPLILRVSLHHTLLRLLEVQPGSPAETRIAAARCPTTATA